MPSQGSNSTHQWVILAENRDGQSVFYRTVKVTGHPAPASHIHVTTACNYAYRKICKMTSDRDGIPTHSLRLPVPTFSPFRTVQHLQSVPEHGSCHGRADGCDEIFMLGDMNKGTLCKLVMYAFEEKLSTSCGNYSDFWNADSPLFNHDSRSVSRKPNISLAISVSSIL